jgi:hypothetical protein
LAAAAKRRTRWEHGHVFTLLTQTPRLLFGALRTARPGLLALALELAVPPLSLLVLVHTLLLVIALAYWQLAGAALPVVIMSISSGLAIVTIMTAWVVFGRRLISPKFLCLLPVYVLWKVPIYLKLLIAPQQKWVRTDRRPTA